MTYKVGRFFLAGYKSSFEIGSNLRIEQSQKTHTNLWMK